MKKVKCLVLKSFKDAEDNDREVKSNSEYICSEERANKLSLLRYVKILEDVSSDSVEESISNNNDDDSSSDVDKETSTNDDEESDLEAGKQSTEDNKDESSSDNKEPAMENEKIETATLIDKTKIKNAKK